MSSALPQPAGSFDPLPMEASQYKPRPWLTQVMLTTIANWGAKLGAVWIGIIAFCAVFAPFLANSFPVAIKMNGRWSSPLLEHLTFADVSLLVITFASIPALLIRRLAFTVRLWIICAIIAVTVTVCWFTVRPPQVEVYEQYRQAQAAGQVQFALNAPIPFSPSDRLRDQFTLNNPHPWAPSRQHLLGTERYGADILSRMIHASRIAMTIGFISTGIALVIGVIIGGLMGYFAGWVDLLGMRLVEIFGEIPTIYLLLAFVAFFPRNIYLIMVIIGLTSWVGNARFVRAEFLKLRNQDFVQAAIAAGLPLRSILFRHLLPNALAPLLVSASFGVASAILAETTLSFLGLGLVDEPSWGQLLNQAVSAGGGFYWWLATFPGLAIFLTVFAYNLVGESLRDALDPKLQKSQ